MFGTFHVKGGRQDIGNERPFMPDCDGAGKTGRKASTRIQDMADLAAGNSKVKLEKVTITRGAMP